MSKRILNALRKAVVIADFKTVEKKFETQGIGLDVIKQYIDDFKKLKDQNRIDSIEKKNIDYWGKYPFEDFKDYVDSIKSQKSKTEERKMKKMEGAVLFYENDDWYVYRILNLDASVLYGSGTKWCITEKDNAHFDNYSRDKNIYFYISKNRSPEDRFYKIAALVDKSGVVDYWDALDKNIKQNKIREHVDLPDVRLDSFEVMVKINGKQYKPNKIPNNISVEGSLHLEGLSINRLPEGLKVSGMLNISKNPIDKIPKLEADTLIAMDCQKTISVDPHIKVNTLHIQHNDIVEIPAFAHPFKELDLSNSTIGKISPDIKIDNLILNKTTIDHLPLFPNVKKLSIQGIKVKTMDLSPNLESLDLSGTKIKKMPGANLKSLICKNGRIESFDPNFNVTEQLILADTKLKYLPDNLTLTLLDVSGSDLTKLPKNLTVDHLSIARCPISTLKVEGLKILSTINISHSGLVDIGDITIDKLFNIRECFMYSKLKTFPVVPKPFKIDELHLTGSHFEKIPNNMVVQDKLILINMPNLKELPKKLTVGLLSLTGTDIKELPPDLNAQVVIAPSNIKVPSTAKAGKIIYK